MDFPQHGQVFSGVFTAKGPHDFAETEAFSAATGQDPPVIAFSSGWAHDSFRQALFDDIAMRGAMPMLYWEPWDYLAPAPREIQPDYALSRIIAGDYDSYIRTWARGIPDLGYPIAIRWAHEMNGQWYPWAEGVNGNSPGEYAQAWRHVHDIFTAEDATDVIWVWSPNVSYAGAPPIDQFYPGHDYVDWAGLVGYLGTPGQDGFVPFNDIFYWTVEEIRELTDKPIVITETGAPSGSEEQIRWVQDMFASLPTYADVIGVVWFEAEAGINFRIADQSEAARHYREALRDERYDVTWTPDIRPLRMGR